jgi:hypothetical protein
MQNGNGLVQNQSDCFMQINVRQVTNPQQISAIKCFL